MLYEIRVMNGATIGKAKSFTGETTVGEVLTDPDFTAILTGSTYSINGTILTPNDYHTTLDDMGLYATKSNYLVAAKAANGNC